MNLHNRQIFFQLVLLLILPIFLGSWVDDSTVDVYSGSIQYSDDNEYPVSHLSGNIEFYLSNYSGLGLDSNGYLINTQANSKIGFCRINGSEFSCRYNSLGGFQIQQSYYSGSSYRNVWISYNLTPDTVPTSFALPEFAIVFLVILVFFLVIIYLLSGGVL